MQFKILCLIIGLFLFLDQNSFADTSKTEWRNLTPTEIVKDMGVGWNLGNSLDTEKPKETGWGNPYTTKAMIDEVAAMGFTTLRLPVTWRFHMGDAPDYLVEEAWLNRVEEVANYAFANNMYVILNVHHDDPWLVPVNENQDEIQDKLGKLWTQIANRFKDYSDYLIFETLNEPRHEGSDKEWKGGTAQERAIINTWHEVAVDAIRATGGNNTNRFLMIAPYAAYGGSAAMNDLVIPNNDPNTIVAIHSYSPYKFCMAGQTKTWGTDTDKQELDKMLDDIVNIFIAKGHAVVMGEWGSMHNDNAKERAKHAEYYAKACKKRGICPVWWDNGQANEYGIFNRKEVSWYHPTIAQAIVSANLLPQTSGNPLIRHIRTADPAVEIWNDGKVWIYASHDQDWATSYQSMDGYHVFSSYDLVNWTDHGEILHSRDVDWGLESGGWMFAPDAAYKNGKYYLYYPHMAKGWEWRVGVAMSDKPEGPFIDQGYVVGTNLIDPCCFVDDDGTPYLIWGGDHKGPYIARLKENMTELAESPREIEYGESNFYEAAYLHKHNDKYYFSYNSNTWPNVGQYAMGYSPYGPFEHKGHLSLNPQGAQIHNSMIEYHGQSYYFYHRGDWGNDASMYRRNVCMDSMFYNADGTIQVVEHTLEGVGIDLIGATPGELIPGKVKGSSYFSKNNDRILPKETEIKNGDCLEYILEIKGDEEYSLSLETSKLSTNTSVDILIDNKPIKTIKLQSDTEIPLNLTHGKHTLKLKFENSQETGSLMNLEWLHFKTNTQFYTIEATSTIGGSIYPEGIKYAAFDESLDFRLNTNSGYILKKILVNGKKVKANKLFVLENISEDTKIEAIYASCKPTALNPEIIADETAQIKDRKISVTEGSRFTLKVSPKKKGTPTWIGPEDILKNSNQKVFNSVEEKQDGLHSLVFESNKGCKTKLDFDVHVKPLILDVFEAEDWVEQEGLKAEGCSDVGRGKNVGFINPGDWATYQFNIDKTGTYNLLARVATNSNGGVIEVSSNNKIIASIKVDGEKSDGWQDWFTTDPVEIDLKEGEQNWKLTFKGTDGLLFNINWFDLILKK